MKIKTLETRYELVEFYFYIDNSNLHSPVSIIELTVDTDDMEYLEKELADIFAVETDKQIYVFSGYEVSECYKDDTGLVKVVCIK